MSKTTILLLSAGLGFFTAKTEGEPGQEQPTPSPDGPDDAPTGPFLRIELPQPESATQPMAGTDHHQIWRPMCGGPSDVSQRDLQQGVRTHQLLLRRPVHVIDTTPSAQRMTSFDLVFVTSSLPVGAAAAISAAETYIESFFTDPITITITCTFAALPPDSQGHAILGQTGSNYTAISYQTARAALVADMDSDDVIQNYLPNTSTFPVDYTNAVGKALIAIPGLTSPVTAAWRRHIGPDEDLVYFTFANWKAVGGVAGTPAGDLTFNTAISWDFDPTNGVGSNSFSFQEVLIHEVGHVMGFGSGGDFRVNDMEALDMYRFQLSDMNSNYNPDSYADFQVTRRLVARNRPDDDHICDVITLQKRMSDGIPFQMSHFREHISRLGIMDPGQGPGESNYPGFYENPDLVMFDAIGYDR